MLCNPSFKLNCGDIELEPDRYECRVRGDDVAVSVLEFNLLRFFVENFNRALTREMILQSVWRDLVVTDRAVDSHISSLRKKLRNSNLTFVSLYGEGYVLREREPTGHL